MRSRVTANDWPTFSRVCSLRDKVRGYDADEFAGRDYLGLLPELWKMALVAGDQVVGTGNVGAFQEFVVGGILCYLKRTRRADELRMVFDELEELLLKAFADLEFRAREDFPVFLENGFGYVKPGRFGHGKNENGALESVRFQGGRHEDICVN